MSDPKHGEEYSFRYIMTLNDLIYCNGMEDMNNFMDEQLERKLGKSHFELTDISYEAVEVKNSDIGITIEASGIIEDMDHEIEELTDQV
jgi:hypothetical protein